MSSPDISLKRYAWVELAPGVVIEEPVIIGKPRSDDPAPTKVGERCVIRSFCVIYEDVHLGSGSAVGHHALIREGNRIGSECKIGSMAALEPGNQIGDRSRVHTGCFLENIEVGEDVFIGPRVVFTDDPHPPCPSYLRCRGGARVEKGAKIGANSTVLPGLTIGSYALIGAGSVVTKDVAPFSVVAGNPARLIGEVGDLQCEKGFYQRPYEWEERE